MPCSEILQCAADKSCNGGLLPLPRAFASPRTSTNTMAIVLPELPWAKDALAPHISAEVSCLMQ